MNLQTFYKGISIIILSLLFSPYNQVFGQNQSDGKQQGPPNFAQLLAEMDANKDGKLAKSEVKGPLLNDFSKIDTNEDGYISEEEFEKAPKPEGGRPPKR